MRLGFCGSVSLFMYKTIAMTAPTAKMVIWSGMVLVCARKGLVWLVRRGLIV